MSCHSRGTDTDRLAASGSGGSTPKRARRAAASAATAANATVVEIGSSDSDDSDQGRNPDRSYKVNRNEAATDYASDYELDADADAVVDEDSDAADEDDDFRPEKRTAAAANKGKGRAKGKAKAPAKGKGKAGAAPAANNANAAPKIRFTLGGGGGGGDGGESSSASQTPTLRVTTGAAEAGGTVPGINFRQDRDYGYLPLRPDQASRPFYIVPSTGHIILENFHPLAKYATDFLVAIAEPVSRPKHIHEYKLTPHSLYAAVSVGLETENIIEVLNRMSKVPVPDELCEFIRECTHSYGKVKMVLKQNKHFVESSDPETLRILLRDKVIADARVPPEEQRARDGAAGGAVPPGGTATYGLEKEKAPTRAGLVIPGTSKAAAAAATTGATGTNGAAGGEGGANGQAGPSGRTQEEEDLFTAVVGLEKGWSAGPSSTRGQSLGDSKLTVPPLRLETEDDMDDDDEVHSFEIRESEIEAVKRRCLDLDYRMMEEYDFRHDEVNPTLEIDLKPSAALRPYQEKSLGKMFGNGSVGDLFAPPPNKVPVPVKAVLTRDCLLFSRARSGVIVLPCGAGKTLVGITAATTIRKSCIVLCTSSVSVMQWRQQFLQWSTIKESAISVFTADQKEKVRCGGGLNLWASALQILIACYLVLLPLRTVLWRRRHRRFDVFDGGEPAEAVARLAKDDGLSHLARVGVHPARRGARRPRRHVPSRRDQDQGAHKTRLDGDAGPRRRQDRRPQLFDRPQVVRGELDGPSRERSHRQGPVRRSVVRHDARVLPRILARVVEEKDAPVLHEPAQVPGLPVLDPVPREPRRQDHRLFGQRLRSRGEFSRGNVATARRLRPAS